MKKNVVVIFGGDSSEHDVSCLSATTVIKNMDTEKYNVILVGITKEGKWLKAHAPIHGFILRYPKRKEHITGYPFEPWHIRFVGKTLSLYLSLTGLTLEEYHGMKLTQTF